MRERVSKEQEDKFYQTMLKLEMQDFKDGKLQMKISDAEFLYNFGIATIYKNGKIEFMED